jgi:hypothetical protein
MMTACRLALVLIGGTAVAMLYAAAILRTLPADPDDAMTAAGMALMLVWPVLVVASAVPARLRTSALFLAANAALALLIGWAS